MNLDFSYLLNLVFDVAKSLNEKNYNKVSNITSFILYAPQHTSPKKSRKKNKIVLN